MLARLQAFFVFCVLLLAAAWWLGSGALGWEMPWRLLGLVLIAAPHAGVLAFEFVLLRRYGRPEPAPAPTLGETARAWWGEVRTGWAVFGWRQPFRSAAEPDHLDERSHRGRRGVVLVHGFVCNRGLWTPWLGAFRRAGVPFVAVNLEPVFGSIDDFAPVVDDAVRRLEQATGVPPLVVAHSMGGLATRAWLRAAQADRRIDGVVTIATPHQGTWLARFAVSRNGRQMRRDSRWLTALAAAEPAERRRRFTCYFGHCDNIVFPAACGTLPGADNRHLAGVAHVDMVGEPAVLAEVFRRLDLQAR